jgi:hypothetical protein
VRIVRRFSPLAFALLGLAALAATALAAVSLVEISTDQYTNPTSQHATEVEPDVVAVGSTIVADFQEGRFFDGGATNVGFATSTNGGATWTQGPLPGITKAQGGTYDRDTDPVMAHDAKHGVWLASTLAMIGTNGSAVVTNRSTDGLTWSNPVVVGGGSNPDKDWITCDDTPTSKFYGNCYVEWDENGIGNRIDMSTSTDGGLTWGPAQNTANLATGIGGQPVVTSKGVVVVPMDNASESDVVYFKSTNGGSSWSATKTIAGITDHEVAGDLRSEPLPSAQIDKSNRIYVVWHDCRFRSGCSANDIVMATLKGSKVSAVVRIPIDPTTSGVDHFIPGIAVDRSTGKTKAHLGLTYYYYPSTSCTQSTCQLDVGFISSTDSGATWSAPVQLAGPMTLSWLANTNQGRMVGDYIAGAFAGGSVFPVVAVAHAPNGSTFDEAMYTATGLPSSGAAPATAGPVVSRASDHPALTAPATAH